MKRRSFIQLAGVVGLGIFLPKKTKASPLIGIDPVEAGWDRTIGYTLTDSVFTYSCDDGQMLSDEVRRFCREDRIRETLRADCKRALQ
tara:strand:- start:288 stop:551 length:264 start_codon:yes stop_codon:yes gene_type:complete